jgi:hypothetical protein
MVVMVWSGLAILSGASIALRASRTPSGVGRAALFLLKPCAAQRPI